MKILFICPYPVGEAPSQRFRFEQYFSLLRNKQIDFKVQSFLTAKNWRIFYARGKIIQKIRALISGYGKRLLLLFRVPAFDFIFIHREAAPLGPPVFEWIVANVLRKKIIYDFDDAIWLTDNLKNVWLTEIIKWRSKVASICRWSYRVSAGNRYLCNYAAQYAKQVIYNPTTLDTKYLHNPTLNRVEKKTEKVVIGWTGSHSTLKYLESLDRELVAVESMFPDISFLVIADQLPKLRVRNLRFLDWSPENEVTGLMEADIGIMPLPNNEWAKGKCGFKALQYMALEIPAIVSAIGVNSSLVTHGEEGLVCYTPNDWIKSLSTLILDSTLRKEMGKKGRLKVINQFSIEANQQNFLSLLDYPIALTQK
ncbi:MAG: glycosyltransferase family 4 protein [Cyclobacteriaceae bacterium]|nr:glycosyltransferase family 4 protein [Cyclobacteriaceae bacterium]